MEVAVTLTSILAVLAIINVQNTAMSSPLHHLTLQDLSPSDRQYLDYLRSEAIRRKRSGDILGSVKSKLSHGFKSKLSGLTSASAHASSLFSGASGSKFSHYPPPPPPIDEEKSFSFWDLQKAIFRTLFQAAKAIKGGLLAVKGQIIKGSGYLISAKGKLISAKGEALSNIGKQIASTAVLISPVGHNTAPSGIVEPVYMSPPSGYSGTSGPSATGGPSGPSGQSIDDYHAHHYEHSPPGSDEHSYPSSFEAYKERHPKSTNQGILIVKKIPKVKGDDHNGNTGAHNLLETHKPVVEPQEIAYLPDAKDTPPIHHHVHNQEIPSPPEEPSQVYQGIAYPSPDTQLSQFVHDSSSLQQFQGQGFISPAFAPHDQNYLKDIQQNSAALETYNPLSLPGGFPSFNLQNAPAAIKGLEHFPSYPLDLHNSFDMEGQYSTLFSEKLLPPPPRKAPSNPTILTKRVYSTKSISRPKPNKHKSVTVWLKP
ncbi:uncharacterized protein LOC116166966 isoform X2 [Photinus pyralis]|uniref:uncharacterized protein LOC116166966 isoform X2 n=1 Tax=Photinus pyralis TaxID=7054 RepID=UPI0012676815|nr:uncharacterized protein LOC116166966 isoform X2 [Photinus pyralis]